MYCPQSIVEELTTKITVKRSSKEEHQADATVTLLHCLTSIILYLQVMQVNGATQVVFQKCL